MISKFRNSTATAPQGVTILGARRNPNTTGGAEHPAKPSHATVEHELERMRDEMRSRVRKLYGEI